MNFWNIILKNTWQSKLSFKDLRLIVKSNNILQQQISLLVKISSCIQLFSTKVSISVTCISSSIFSSTKKLLENIEGGLVFSKDGDAIWKCRNCGHIVIGKQAPAVCPVCNHPQSFFEVKAENY